LPHPRPRSRAAARGRALYDVRIALSALQCNIDAWMGFVRRIPLKESDPKFRVAVCASGDGRFTFEIYTAAGEPRTLQANRRHYATPDDANRAGHAAIAAKRF
jgi:hypothetical protein